MSNSKTREEKNAQHRAWYHRVGYSGHKVRNHKMRVEKTKQWFIKYKETLKCIRCGESHIATLDFHHKNPSEKETNISKTVLSGWSVKRIESELQKCDVLCANCHRILHYEEKQLHPLKEISELTNDEKPKYIGYHGNGLGPLPVEQTHTLLKCSFCKKDFLRRNSNTKRQIKRGCTKSYCSTKCYIESKHRDKKRI